MANIDCPKRNTCNCSDKQLQGRPGAISGYREQAIEGYLIQDHATKKVLFKTRCFAEYQMNQDHFSPETDSGAIECFGYKKYEEVKIG